MEDSLRITLSDCKNFNCNKLCEERETYDLYFPYCNSLLGLTLNIFLGIPRVFLQNAYFVKPIYLAIFFLISNVFLISNAKGDHIESFVGMPLKKGPFPLVIFIHGSEGSAVQFQSSFHDFIKSGVMTLSISLPGYGESDGSSDFFGNKDLSFLQKYLSRFLKEKEKFIDKSKILIYGHSAGGILAANLLNTNIPVAGVILESTPLSLKNEVRPESPSECSLSDHSQSKKPTGPFKRFILFLKKLYFYYRLGDLSEKTLQTRSPIDTIQNKKQPILLLYGNRDFRYSRDVINRQVDKLQIRNPYSKIVLDFFEGGHNLDDRSPTHNMAIKNFVDKTILLR